LTIKEAIILILDELARAGKKFPSWPEDQIRAAAILAEEAGETIKAALAFEYQRGSLEELKKEAIQTGAMSIRLLLNLEEGEKKR
jgi:NTP pyrophosphatase (non-canonical NTP hydrolase)